jgi:hypothetical protein
MELRPFGSEDALRADVDLRRRGALGQALWGKTQEDLRRQLAGRNPEIPVGFELEDFRGLARTLQIASASMGDPRIAWLSRWIDSLPSIFVGTQQFTSWEARCEIVRRAIEYLEKR